MLSPKAMYTGAEASLGAGAGAARPARAARAASPLGISARPAALAAGAAGDGQDRQGVDRWPAPAAHAKAAPPDGVARSTGRPGAAFSGFSGFSGFSAISARRSGRPEVSSSIAVQPRGRAARTSRRRRSEREPASKLGYSQPAGPIVAGAPQRPSW